jgi:hypothetical protein
MSTLQNDRIFRSTRIIAAVVVPFLVLAFVILYLFPGRSGQHFAWEIQPNMTALFMGAGYLGGAWLFVNAIFGRQWHRVAAGFLPVTSFTVAMLLATLLHWSRFDLHHFPFVLWLALYIVTPFLVPWMWFRNRVTDPHTLDADDLTVPLVARWGLRLLGILLLLFAVMGFVVPDWFIQFWPWKLSPLTARVLGGWFSLLGVGGVVISLDSRWSAWRVGLQSIGLWHFLVVVGAILNRSEFVGGLVNWYVISVAAVLIGMAWLFIYMEGRRSHQVGAPREEEGHDGL